MVDTQVIQLFETKYQSRSEPTEQECADEDLFARLTHAFMDIAKEKDRLQLVQFAESLVDQIWDY